MRELGKQRKFILDNKDKIAVYVLEHGKFAAAKKFNLSGGGIDSALYKCGFKEKCSPWYLEVQAGTYKPGKVRIKKSKIYIPEQDILEKAIESGRIGELLSKSLEYLFDTVKTLRDQNNSLTIQASTLSIEKEKLARKLEEVQIQKHLLEKVNYNILLQKAKDAMCTPGD